MDKAQIIKVRDEIRHHVEQIESHGAVRLENTLYDIQKQCVEIKRWVDALDIIMSSMEREGNDSSDDKGQAPAGKRVDTVKQAQEAVAPRCPKHKVPLAYRRGRRGPFWSCPVKEADGEWCRTTQEVSRP